MSDNNASNKSTAEDKKMKATWLLLDDNEQKLKSAEKLKASIDKLSMSLQFDDDDDHQTMSDLMEVHSNIKSSYDVSKRNLHQINPEAKQIEEARKRMKASADAESIDVAEALCSMHQRVDNNPKTVRLKLTYLKSENFRYKNKSIKDHIDLPVPASGDVHAPVEIWDIFEHLKTSNDCVK